MRKIILSAPIFVIGLLFISQSSYSQTETLFTVTNNSGVAVTGVYLSPNDLKTWGDNLYVTSDNKLANLGTFTFKRTIDPANCVYDLRFIGEDGKTYYINDLNLCTGNSISLQIPIDKKIK